MKAYTIKQAKELGQELILGSDIKSRVTTTVRALYLAHVNQDVKAERPLVALWETCATDKPTLAVIRSIFNRVTKAVHKELNMDKRAMVVKDGHLVEAQQRGSNSASGGNGGGDSAEGGEGSEGEHVLNSKGEAVSTKENNRELMAHLKILAEAHDKSNDVALRAALKYAIANLV